MIYLYLLIVAAAYIVVMLLFWRFVKAPADRRGFLISRLIMIALVIAAFTIFNVFRLPNRNLGYVLIAILIAAYGIEHSVNSGGKTDKGEASGAGQGAAEADEPGARETAADEKISASGEAEDENPKGAR